MLTDIVRGIASTTGCTSLEFPTFTGDQQRRCCGGTPLECGRGRGQPGSSS